jgi:predicted metal-dependent HD superfamily phosphohydrolase
VPDADFRAGRKAVLEDLLAHDTLFHSDAARQRWEAKARANVTAEVAALS